MITAPFNFVPLSEKVFFPDWAEDISHDIPFEDGESGEIDITITAKSPIFIRDHEKKEQFCQHNGTYYIPGSSVKGMVRNVLEIMSFSKMSQVNDDTYAVRDLSSSKNFYMTQMNQLEEPFTQCGWLKKVGDEYIIEDCGIPLRISHREIDKATKKSFAKHFERDGFEKTSEYKYKILGQTHQKISVGTPYISSKNAKYDKRLFCRYDENGTEGTLVVTGQPTKRENTGQMGDGKGYEFIFLNVRKALNITQKAMENFFFAYFDKRDTEPKESPDWTYWKKKLENDEKVPVFFQKNGSQIVHFGLSYLYKLPYKHSVKDGMKESHFDDRLDLAQCIFGYINDKKGLKGRVQFSHFKATSNIKQLSSRKEILGTPRASYYPMYVRQHNTDFKTFMDSNFSIAGWKLYPIHRGTQTKKTQDTGNENVGTTFEPLKDGVVFEGKLRYHNLRKAELGALLSVLTFHNTSNTFHNIGMAKSLGYGKIALKLDTVYDTDTYLKDFELEVSQQITNWRDSPQIKELLTMATEQNNGGNSKLEYMPLPKFASSKSNDKDYLRCYTELDSIDAITIKTLLMPEEISKLDEKYNAFIEKEKAFKVKQKAKKEYEDMLALIRVTNNIALIDVFLSKYPDSSDIKEAERLKAKIAEAIEKEKADVIDSKSIEEWDRLIENKKYLTQDRIEKFIITYPISSKLSDANKELDKFEKSKPKSAKEISINELDTVKDSKDFKSVLAEFTTFDDEQIEIIKCNAIRVHSLLKKKAKKKFFAEIQLGSKLGKEFDEAVQALANEN